MWGVKMCLKINGRCKNVFKTMWVQKCVLNQCEIKNVFKPNVRCKNVFRPMRDVEQEENTKTPVLFEDKCGETLDC